MKKIKKVQILIILGALLFVAALGFSQPATKVAAEVIAENYSSSTTLNEDWYRSCTVTGSSSASNPVVITISSSIHVSGYNNDMLSGGLRFTSGHATLTSSSASSTGTVTRLKSGSWRYTGPMIYIAPGATLTIKNMIIDGVDQDGNEVSAICAAIINEGTLILENTIVKNNKNTSEPGGGVYNTTTSSILTMKSGYIRDNYCSYSTGGVFNNGTFTLDGGYIINNESNDGAGGVYNHGTFTQNGGAIYGNLAHYTGSYDQFFSTGGSTLVWRQGVIYGEAKHSANANTPYDDEEYMHWGLVNGSVGTTITVNGITIPNVQTGVDLVCNKYPTSNNGTTGVLTSPYWNFATVPTKVTLTNKTLDYSGTNVTTTLIPTFTPTNPENTTLTWESSKPLVASVNSSGVVTGKSIGTTTITATSVTGVVGSCVITVRGTKYNVVHTLTSITATSNTSGTDKATYGTDYTTTLSSAIYHKLPSSITVKIGSNTLASSDYTYNATTGAVTIPGSQVTGAVTIIATGVPVSYNVTHTLTNITATSNTSGTDKATYNTDYTTTLTPNANYHLPTSITVMIGASTLNSSYYTYNPTTGTVTIPGSKVTGAVKITANGTAYTYHVTHNLTNLVGTDGTSGTGKAMYNTNYTTSLSAVGYYHVPSSITILIGDNELAASNYTYDPTNGSISIQGSSIIAAVTITANGVANTYSVAHNLSNIMATPNTSGVNKATYGVSYTTTLEASNYYNLPPTIEITIGGNPLAGSDYYHWYCNYR